MSCVRRARRQSSKRTVNVRTLVTARFVAIAIKASSKIGEGPKEEASDDDDGDGEEDSCEG